MSRRERELVCAEASPGCHTVALITLLWIAFPRWRREMCRGRRAIGRRTRLRLLRTAPAIARRQEAHAERAGHAGKLAIDIALVMVSLCGIFPAAVASMVCVWLRWLHARRTLHDASLAWHAEKVAEELQRSKGVRARGFHPAMRRRMKPSGFRDRDELILVCAERGEKASRRCPSEESAPASNTFATQYPRPNARLCCVVSWLIVCWRGFDEALSAICVCSCAIFPVAWSLVALALRSSSYVLASLVKRSQVRVAAATRRFALWLQPHRGCAAVGESATSSRFTQRCVDPSQLRSPASWGQRFWQWRARGAASRLWTRLGTASCGRTK